MSIEFLNKYDGDRSTALNAINQAISTKKALVEIPQLIAAKEFISLGNNCSTAHYLKSLGLRKAAYPFDWTFCSPEIIHDCLDDDFVAFLDKGKMRQHLSKPAITHVDYHEYFFAHKNPLASSEDYQYYQRACHRFLSVPESLPVCFVLSPIVEPSKRIGWSSGFTQKYKLPPAFSMTLTMALIEKLKIRFPDCYILIVEQYTQLTPSSSLTTVTSDYAHVRFNAQGKSTGAYFVDELDDYCFKLIFSGFMKEFTTENSVFKKESIN